MDATGLMRPRRASFIMDTIIGFIILPFFTTSNAGIFTPTSLNDSYFHNSAPAFSVGFGHHLNVAHHYPNFYHPPSRPQFRPPYFPIGKPYPGSHSSAAGSYKPPSTANSVSHNVNANSGTQSAAWQPVISNPLMPATNMIHQPAIINLYQEEHHESGAAGSSISAIAAVSSSSLTSSGSTITHASVGNNEAKKPKPAADSSPTAAVAGTIQASSQIQTAAGNPKPATGSENIAVTPNLNPVDFSTNNINQYNPCPQFEKFYRRNSQTIFYPHEKYCSKFYICSFGQGFELQCPSGQLWDDVNKTCNFSKKVNCSIQLVA